MTPQRRVLSRRTAKAAALIRPSRRALLLAAAALAATGGATPPPGGTDAPEAEDPYETLRRRWLGIALGAGYDPAAEPYASRLTETGELARGLRATMAPAANSLWPGHPFDPPAGITLSYGRLWTMTQAYVQQGTGSTADPDLLADVLRGLDHLSATVYNPATTRYGNWWEWQIGSPRLLTDITTALYDQLGDTRVQAACAAVDHFVPDSALGDYTGTSTGANRVDLCRSVALRGILGRDPAKIALARDALSPVFPYVTRGDGLYVDGSFVQHTWVAYSGTYGQVMLDGLGRLFALLAGSDWAVTDPNRQIILDSVEHAYAPLIHDGLVMDSVNGRAISRGYLTTDDRKVMRSDHFHGQQLIAAIALLAAGASEAERDRWHARVKGWIERDTVTPILTAPQFGVADLARLHAIAASPAPAAPEPTGHHLFAAMDRAVHRRPGFTANIAMASDRIAHYECGNGENPRGWHTGAGMVPGGPRARATSTRTGSGRPSTGTACPAPPSPPSGSPTRKAASGASPPGRALGRRHDRRRVRGARPAPQGPRLHPPSPQVLVLRRGRGDLPRRRDQLRRRRPGRDRRRQPQPRRVRHPALRQAARAGPTWRTTAAGWLLGREPTAPCARTAPAPGPTSTPAAPPEPRTRRWQTLWLDHGTDPEDATYIYVLMPGASRHAVARRAADRRWLSVLANDAVPPGGPRALPRPDGRQLLAGRARRARSPPPPVRACCSAAGAVPLRSA